VLSGALWAGLAASTLLIGAVLGTVLDVPRRVVGLVMGFGAGALIASVSFELTEDAFALGGGVPLALGLALGGLVFFLGDTAIDRLGPSNERGDSGLALLLGAVLDGIPESLIIGLSLTRGSIEIAFIVSVAISNLPEGFVSSEDERAAGVPTRTILLRWLSVVIVSTIFGAIGYAASARLSTDSVAFIEAFAAGALLTMVIDSMAPEAYRDAGALTGLAAVAGYAFAYFLSTP
jgi:zinc transporter, ZIP family